VAGAPNSLVNEGKINPDGPFLYKKFFCDIPMPNIVLLDAS
jgi:hypothetical protein